MNISRRRPRERRVDTFITRTLVFLVAATLIPALGWTVGTVAAEVAHRASGEQKAAEYPPAYPSIGQVQVLADTIAVVPSLGIDWRWAELDSRPACGTAILAARIVLLDPGMGCDLRATIRHEWAHIAQVEYYGGDNTPNGTIISDQVDDHGDPYVLDVQEIVADCASYLLTDEVGGGQPDRSYLPMLGGCPPEMLGLAREIVTHAGVRLTPGTASALGSVGAGVA